MLIQKLGIKNIAKNLYYWVTANKFLLSVKEKIF